MKTQKKEIEVFIADDGKEFLIERECKDYEDNFSKRLKNIKYFKVYCKPDLTEGRGYNATYYIAVESEDFLHLEFLENYCYCVFGSKIAFVMGASPMLNWKINEIEKEIFQKAENKSLISQNIKPIPGLNWISKLY